MILYYDGKNDKVTKVKPYFDVDYLDTENKYFDQNKRNEIKESIINILSDEFKKPDIIYSEFHRLKGNGFKYSFHFYIDNYVTTPRDIGAFLESLENNKWNLDKSTYKCYGSFRFSMSKKDETNNFYPILSNPYRIQDYIITNVKEDTKIYNFEST